MKSAIHRRAIAKAAALYLTTPDAVLHSLCNPAIYARQAFISALSFHICNSGALQQTVSQIPAVQLQYGVRRASAAISDALQAHASRNDTRVAAESVLCELRG